MVIGLLAIKVRASANQEPMEAMGLAQVSQSDSESGCAAAVQTVRCCCSR